MDPYKRAVRDYENSVDVQNSLANYHLLVQNINGNYNAIVKLAGELYGEESVRELKGAKERMDRELAKYRLSGEIERTRELEEVIRDYREKEEALRERAAADQKLEGLQLKLLKHFNEQREEHRRSLDTLSKIIFINEGAVAEKDVRVSRLTTTLFFMVLIAVIFYGSYINILSPSAFNWLFAIAVIAYVITILGNSFWMGYYRLKFWLLSLIAPGLVQRSCPNQAS